MSVQLNHNITHGYSSRSPRHMAKADVKKQCISVGIPRRSRSKQITGRAFVRCVGLIVSNILPGSRTPFRLIPLEADANNATSDALFSLFFFSLDERLVLL
jgi:hypothetical protein